MKSLANQEHLYGGLVPSLGHGTPFPNPAQGYVPPQRGAVLKRKSPVSLAESEMTLEERKPLDQAGDRQTLTFGLGRENKSR